MTDDSTTGRPVGGMVRLIGLTLSHKLTAYGRDSAKLGTVDQLVVDMETGRAEYAILSLGGFLGLGQKYHPVPFALLRLSTDKVGYVVDIERSLIDGSPSYRSDDAPPFDDAYGQRIRTYYSHLATAP